MKKFNIAVVGATGMVGGKFLEVLTERKLPVENYYLFASSKSAGRQIDFMGSPHTVIELNEENVLALSGKIDFALFSAGAAVSRDYAPLFVKAGATVVDNSSQWRMYNDVPLVVPEVNPEDVLWNRGIIANPNCSTIQAVVALKPLQDAFGIKRVVYSTYQAVSGAGVAGYNDLKEGVNGVPPKKFPQPIAYNMLPHIDVFMEDGYTKEEWKMIAETRKILHDDAMKVTATAVRVPVYFGHSESINVEFERPCAREDILNALNAAAGLIVLDDPANSVYPTPLLAENRDEVFVGRIRIDDSLDSGANIWVVADNIRKGAATNAVQIVELLIKNALEG
ncbi:MAG: aspartate-semialdehyde dehydrogenase [Bacteroides sp.]|nr:aspartate-semialdehyde dehydrogenase [Bacillota bacterium]MCM1393685.1 aspartate-semialdehyde dehydrogenase [[Eubacterium] siraeum]MCM1455216.1 aspartate-semialdehyde dehydrogenase [Bacteroides sp.]